MNEQRTTELTRIDLNHSTIDHLCIGGWLQLEMMDANKDGFTYDLHIGDAQFSVSVPKNPKKLVEVMRVE